MSVLETESILTGEGVSVMVRPFHLLEQGTLNDEEGPPCTNQFRSVVFDNASIFYFFTE
jgi:hypothetical protein